MARRLYVNTDNIVEVVARLNRRQCESGVFYNIAVKPYKGKKYGKGKITVIVVG